MTYNEEWDETTPPGGQGAYLGDDAIRQLKRGLAERFETVFTNWPEGDPADYGGLELIEDQVTRHIPTIVPLLQGTLAARPDPPELAGQLYWTTDTDQMFLSEGAAPVVWTEFAPKQMTAGLLANRPEPDGVKLYFAADTKQMFVSFYEGAAYVWGELSPQLVHVSSKPAFPNPPEKAGLLAWATDEEELYVSLSLAGSFIWRSTQSAAIPPLYVFDEGGVAAPTAWRIDPHVVQLRVTIGITIGVVSDLVRAGEFDLNRVPDELMNLATNPLVSVLAQTQSEDYRVVSAQVMDDATARGDLRVWLERVDGTAPVTNDEVPVDLRLIYYSLVGAQDIS